MNAEKKHLEKEIKRVTNLKSSALYILTWNAKMPTPEKHHQVWEDYYCTWNSADGNAADGTVKNTQDFKLYGGVMDVYLRVGKINSRLPCIVAHFHLTDSNRGYGEIHLVD